MSQIPLRQRRLARRAARNAWLRSGGDLELAKEFYEEEMKTTSIDPATLLLLLQIAIQLWMWWRSQKVSEPSVVASADEPGFELDDDTEDPGSE